ncbi:hypothetical protein AB1286_32985 [Trinickia sp. NRRL B-1857]|uniref:hypothetical protein n=1 Tax=Trinickia sp. NRRL B-1857 TaxID=3162879 RepID=UPI003D2881D2
MANMFGVEIDTLIGQAGAKAVRHTPEIESVSPVPNALGIAPEEVIRYVVVLRFAPRAEIPVEQVFSLIRQFGGQARHDRYVAAYFGMSQAYGSDSRRALMCAMTLLRSQWIGGERPAVLELQRWADDRGWPGAARAVRRAIGRGGRVCGASACRPVVALV